MRTVKLYKLEKRALYLKDPEITGDACLDFEDAMDALRLRADAIKGTLGLFYLENGLHFVFEVYFCWS